MSETIVGLLPVILGALLAPAYPIIVLLLLQSAHGLAKAAAFVAGAIAVRLVQGAIFGLVFRPATDAEAAAGLAVIVPTLLTAIGILLLVAAYKKWRKEADPDDPPPQWMATLGNLSALKAAGAGALFVAVAVKQWVFTLSAIAVIEEAQLGLTTGVLLYLLFTLATQVFVLLPLGAFAVAPQWSARPLQATEAWLERHNRTIAVAVALLFGAFFLYQGITGLLAFGAP